MTGLVTAQTYAAAMTRTYTDIAEQTARFAANLGDHGVAGPAVAAVTHAQEATQAAATGWAQATTALQHQTTVREAYTAVPDAGGKAFLTNPQRDQATDGPAGGSSPVLPAFRDPPAPTLVLDGPVAVLSGVRWVWQDQCRHCRQWTYVVADGGRLSTGISVYRSRTGKTERIRWFDREQPARPVDPPTVCTQCGQDRPFLMAQSFPRGFRQGMPHGHLEVLSEGWRQIRAGFPELVAKADAAAAGLR